MQNFIKEDGEYYKDLGKNKRLKLKTYKGAVYVDIREYYSAEGAMKPGKKGITLSWEQWEELLESAKELEELRAEINK